MDDVSGRTIDVSEFVRRKAATQRGVGLRWLENLGDLVEELERDWEVTVGSTLREAGDGGKRRVRKRDPDAPRR
ncbi:MAG: hypothetical protein ACRDN6_14850 [Gaiellaceae bacterium]